MSDIEDPPCSSGGIEVNLQSRYDNAVALLKSGRIQEALGNFRLLLAESPDDNWSAVLLLSEVKCYTALGRLDDADRVLVEISKLAPMDAIKMNAAFVATWILAQRGEHKKAAFEYGIMLQKYAHLWDTAEYRDVYEDICFRRASELTKSGEHREAAQIFRNATLFLSLKAEDRQEAHFWLGAHYEELREYDQAIREYLHVIEFNFINDQEVEAHYRLARLYFDRGGFAQAKHQLETIIRDYSKASMPIPLAYVYEQLSRVYHYLGEKENAKLYAKLSKNLSKD